MMSKSGGQHEETTVGGHPTDYERLIQPIEDRMIRSVWRIVRDPNDFDDAFQEALAAIWKRLRRILRHPNPHALVLRICANAAYDVLRDRARRRRQVESIPADAAYGVSAADLLSDREKREEILGAIARLPRRQAESALMRFSEELSYKDIAEAIGCSEVTARTHVKRARVRLAALLAHLVPGSSKETAK
jgi:RNA polymerase sigma factor (sigma-70 family)